ncbi:TspO/MBR family protein [Polaribacter sp. M15]
MKQIKLTLLFLVINFGGLAIGNWLMDNGPMTDWYANLNKAPWTPPGWVFGVAWTTIMICFSIYLGKLFLVDNSQKMKVLFFVQFILNVSWNYLFFNQHWVFLGLVNITFLTALLCLYFFKFSTKINHYKYLILPYMIWLCIATSLNLYVLIYN